MDMAGARKIDFAVELGLEPVSMTRARTRRVEVEIVRHGEAFNDLPELGDPFCRLTVRTRLHRVGKRFWREPHTSLTVMAGRVRRSIGKDGKAVVEVFEGLRSCMPDIVREASKLDSPNDTRSRQVVSAAERSATDLVLDSLITYWDKPEKLKTWWAIALKRHAGGKDGLCHDLGGSDKTARDRMDAMLGELARDWRRRRWMPDAVDIDRVHAIFHRKVT